MLRKFLPILLLTFVNVIGFTLLIPVLTSISQQYTSEEVSPIIFGALLSTYALCQFLAAPILGSLSDKYGRKPVLVVSQLGTTLSWVVFCLAYFLSSLEVFGFALPLWVILFSRVVDGLTGGNISVANAWVSDVSSKEEKAQAFGIIGATFGLGFLIGPALGGLSNATEIGYLGTGLLAFVISLVTLAFVIWGLPESLKEENKDKELEIKFWSELNFFKKFGTFNQNHLVKNLLISRVFFAFVFASYVTVIVVFLERQFELGSLGLGLTLSLIGLYSVFNQALLVGRITKMFGDLGALLGSVFLVAIGLAMLPFIPPDLAGTNFLGLDINASYVLFLTNAYFINLGISVAMPSFKAIVSNNVSEKNQGLAIGLDESILSLGQGVTPIAAGLLYASLGPNTFFAYALVLIASHIWLWRVLRGKIN